MTYPAPVVAAGPIAEAVYDLSTTAGIKNATNKALPADTASLPAGASISGAVITFASNFAVSRFDLTAYELSIAAGVVGTFTDCKVKVAHLTGSPYHISFTGTGADVHFIDCTGDLVTDHLDWGGCHVSAGNTVRSTRSRWTGANSDYFFGAGAFIGVDSYIGPPGNFCSADTHLEQAKCDGAASSLTRCFLDGETGGVLHTIGVNGGLAGHSYNDNSTLTVTNCICIGMVGLGSNWSFAVTYDGSPTVLNLVDNIIQAGLSGYVAVTGAATLNHSGNRDYDNGGAILGDTIAPWSAGIGAATLVLTGTGAGDVGASGSGAKTLDLAASAAGAVFGPVIGGAISTLNITASASGSSVTGAGDAGLVLVASGSGALSGAASGEGSGALSLGASATGSAGGASGVGSATLTLINGGLGSASGLAAPARGGGTKTAPGRVGKTKTAGPRSSTTIIAA